MEHHDKMEPVPAGRENLVDTDLLVQASGWSAHLAAGWIRSATVLCFALLRMACTGDALATEILDFG